MKTPATPDFFQSKKKPLVASPRRGTAHDTQLAVKLVADHPLGTELSSEKLDEWFAKHGEFILPPDGIDKKSDAWMAHLQRRHQTIKRVNKSSSHPRMTEMGGTPFVIVSMTGKFLIRAPQEQIVRGEVPKKVLSLLLYKRTHLRYLMESADWSVLPAYERIFAESLERDLDLFEVHIRSSADSLSMKFAEIEGKLRRALATGEIVPKNGGIKKFLSPASETEDGVS